MRHLALLILTIVAWDGTVCAQVLVPDSEIPQTANVACTRLSPDDMVQRLMSFDADKDGKLQQRELIARMSGLITLADTNNDAVLDRSEILEVASRSLQESRETVLVTGMPGLRSSPYDTPRRLIVEAITDLRLPPPLREQALTAAAAYLKELDERETAKRPDGGYVHYYAVRAHLIDEERRELMVQLTGILSEEERVDLDAALQRRPWIGGIQPDLRFLRCLVPGIQIPTSSVSPPHG